MMIKNFAATSVNDGVVFKVEFEVDFFVPKGRHVSLQTSRARLGWWMLNKLFVFVLLFKYCQFLCFLTLSEYHR